jgi:branched-chain amino acid transport system substrate-binding protein
MNALLDSICKAGLNRARIHDALADIEKYDGVTGHMVFDPNQKNVAPMYLGTVHNGAITYRVATMEKATCGGADAAGAAGDCLGRGCIDRGCPMRAWARMAWIMPGRTRRRSGWAGARGALWAKGRPRSPQSPEVQAELAFGAAKGRPWKLLPVESDQNWGAASTALVHALMDEHALAIVALDRDSSHLAEQLALKSFVPVVALSSDKSLTSTIFRGSSGCRRRLRRPACAAMLVAADRLPQRGQSGAAEGCAGFAGFRHQDWFAI